MRSGHSNKPAPSADLDAALETAILELLTERGLDKTICPSDAARRVSPQGWKSLMEATRAAARRLVRRGLIAVTQGGVAVDASKARGAIRLKRIANLTPANG